MCISACIYVLVGFCRGQRALRFLRPGVIGSCQFLDMDAGD